MKTFRLTTTVQFKELLEYQNNIEFNCYLWDNIPYNDSKDVVIMFNGFLEGVSSDRMQRERFLFRYKLIAEELNAKGVVAILLPLPFHFDRCVGVSNDDIASPIARLSIHGSFLYYGGFTQVVTDIKALHDKIMISPWDFKLSHDFRVNILGYSIGGISAITTSNYLSNVLKIKVNSLVLMLSAWKVQDIDPNAIGGFFNTEPNLNAESWSRMLNELEIIQNDPSVDPLFKHLIWGTGDEINFEQMASKVLFIEGQFDEIFTPTIILDRKQNIQRRNLKNCSFISIPSNHLALRESRTLAKYIGLFLSL
jgi:hypothetical protein